MHFFPSDFITDSNPFLIYLKKKNVDKQDSWRVYEDFIAFYADFDTKD